jgi:steroid delta-isomerase-like uncharacterized protein
MSDANKNLIRHYRNINNTDQLDQLGNVLAANFVPHNLMPGMTPALETYKQIHTMAKASFPDQTVTTEDLLADGEKVIERWSMTMTHTGTPFFGLPASGKSVRTSGINIYRIENGQIAEMWADMDFFGVMVQLGAIPAPGM